MSEALSNPELVTLAVYLLGGELNKIDTEDIAIKVNELAPDRFVWKKYTDQINIVNVRIALSDAKMPNKYGYIVGSIKEGWGLSKKGLTYSKSKIKELKGVEISHVPLNKQGVLWQRHEKDRMLSTAAYQKLKLNKKSEITPREADEFFRVDEYVTGRLRETKLSRIINTFKNDPDLGWAIKIISEKVIKK